MSNPLSIESDPLAIKSIIEALIFASDEPLSSRMLIKLLAGEGARPSDRVPPLLRMIEGAAGDASETEAGDVDENGVEDQPVKAPPVEEPGIEPPEEEPPGDEPTIDEPPADEPPVEEPTIDEPPMEEPDVPTPQIDEAIDGVRNQTRQGGISLVLDEEDESADGPEDDDSAGVDDLADAMQQAGRRSSKRSSQADAGSLDQRYIRRIIEQLNDEYDEGNRAFRIVEVAGGFQFATLREYGEYVALLSKEKSRRRLSAAALETLAIIAYRQPVSKPEIEAIRGVNCDQVLLNLMEKNLIVINGRSEAVGRPLLYGTTDDFLRSFGLNSVSDLPKLREIEELMETDAFTAESTEVVMIDEETDVEEIEARVGAMGHLKQESEDGKEISDVIDVPQEEAPASSQSDAEDLVEHEEHSEEEIG